MRHWEEVAGELSTVTGTEWRVRASLSPSAALMEDRKRHLCFVKAAPRDLADRFHAESEALATIAATGTVRVPATVAVGSTDLSCFIALEHLELRTLMPQTEAALGQQLAAMHRQTESVFGWKRDNAIGASPQSNRPHRNWADFWKAERIGAQLQMTRRNNSASSILPKGEKLCARVADFFRDYEPVPSLLHGDLWQGNVGSLSEGAPVIFDPATYYGDRETDIAMTELFGGFSARFYDSYNEAWPLDSGYVRRRSLYNVYHLLNHANIFGGHYWTQAESTIDRLLVELG